MKQYLFHSLDDLQDIIDLCQQTALSFPELASSHDEIGLFEKESDASALCYYVDQLYRNNDQVSTEMERKGPVYIARVVYSLSPEEFDESMGALQDYLEDMEPMDYNNPADRELIDTAREIMGSGILDEILDELNKEKEKDDS
jgi:hypothetical protein